MMGSKEMFGILAATQAMGGISDAYRSSVFAGMQAELIESQIREMKGRADIRSEQIKERGTRAAAEQAVTFLKAGVDLSIGTPMSVMASTLAQATEAAMMQQRQTQFDTVGLQLQQAGLETQASSETLMLKSLGSIMNAGAGYMSNTRDTKKG